jgi:hypothetical protein
LSAAWKSFWRALLGKLLGALIGKLFVERCFVGYLEKVTKKASFSAAGKAVLRALFIGLIGALLKSCL